jgi:hypothetical protein
MRAGHIEKRPASSPTHFVGNDLSIIAHGRGSILGPGDPEFSEIESIQKEASGNSVREWGEGIYIPVDADGLYSFERHPEQFPE